MMKLNYFQPFALYSILILFALQAHTQTNSSGSKPRIIITADPELDDNNSLIRLLLYSTDLQIEGLIYASSQFHWKGDGKGTKWFVPGREYDRFQMNVCPCETWRWNKNERFIHDIVEAYEKVYHNLKIHNSSYPTPAHLKSKIRYGNIEFDGDYSKDSPGSDLIKSILLDNKTGPVYITAWGGHSTIARALKSIQDLYQYNTEWDQIRNKIYRKLVLLPSGDQDDTYTKYIKPNWPLIEYRQFRNGPKYGYGAQINASIDNAPFLTPTWMKENISDRGPLGALYRVWGDGKQMVKDDKVDFFGFSGLTGEELKRMGYKVWMPIQEKGSWLGEGDNHTFMNMLDNGLRAYENGNYGGWGGISIESKDDADPFNLSLGLTEEQMATRMKAQDIQNNTGFPNFFPQAQHSFANRMKWAVSNKYNDANHEPLLTIQGPLHILAAAGQKILLHGLASDPDKNNVRLKWWQFSLHSTAEKVEINNPELEKTEVLIPKEIKAGQNIHIILEATDDGIPALTTYQRVIITIKN